MTPGMGEPDTLTYLGNGQWRFTTRDMGYDGDEFAGSVSVNWGDGSSSSASGEDLENLNHTYSGINSVTLIATYDIDGYSPVVTIQISEVNPDNPHQLQAGDMVGVVASRDHQDRNSDEDSDCYTYAAFFKDFDTLSIGSKSSSGVPYLSTPAVYWSYSAQTVWDGVGEVGDCIGSNNANLEHTATMGGATYKIRFRQILNASVPYGISLNLSNANVNLVTSSTWDMYHSFLPGTHMQAFYKVAGDSDNYNYIEAYVHEVTGDVGGGGASTTPGPVDVTVRGMDASHNTLATDTEATTFDSSKYYRVNVNAIGVDHWGWNIDGGSETMMPAGSTYFVINGADYQAPGGSSTIAVGDVIGLMVYGTETQTSSQDSDEADFRYVVLNGIFDSVNLPLDPGSSPGWNERTGKTMQALINDKNVWQPGYSGNKQPLDGIIASLAATSTGDAWHVGDINEGQTTSFYQSGHIAGGTTHAGVGLRFLATTGNTTYTLGITSASVFSSGGGNAMPYLKNGGSNSFWSPYSVNRNIDYYHVHEIEVINIATTSSTFDTSDRSLWGGTNYPKLDIFYAHGHGGTYNGYGTGYTKTFINWTQGYGFSHGSPHGDSWMWTHTGHTGPVYGYRKIKGRWLGDARGLGDDDGTPVYPGYNFGFWAQAHVSPPADGIYPDGSTRPHSANISSSSHANITYGYDLSNNGNPAPVTDSNGVMTWERAMMGPISDVMEYDVTIGNQNLQGQGSYNLFRGITFDENVGFGLRSTSWDEGSDGETAGTMFRGAAFLVVGFQDDAGVWHYKDEYL
ncbi:MAG: hypothetical protein CMK37_08300 [Porticoccaceae bacterium]|nr:hypothetical protein [Porticoccaceae bacterium]|tara:strand:- start:9717 stop:12101 length:2385 start_codon:yes stop_codon:yes gene_type:complete